MFSKTYRLIERRGKYRAQWSRLGWIWNDIAHTHYGVYTCRWLDDDWKYHTKEYAEQAVAAFKDAEALRKTPWRLVA